MSLGKLDLAEGRNILKCPSCKGDSLYFRSDYKYCCDFCCKAYLDFQLLIGGVQ